jgi:hypothetical protein
MLCLQGALTHGDRRATESRDLSRFNIDNKYGRQALDNVMKTVVGMDNPLCAPPASYKGNFFDGERWFFTAFHYRYETRPADVQGLYAGV